MPYAVDQDKCGEDVLVRGILLAPLPARLSESDLEEGDVLVWYSVERGRLGATIREATRGPYIHTGIYVGSGVSVDAGPEGVAPAPVSSLLESFEYGRVLRYRSISPSKSALVVNAAQNFIGYKYAWLDAIGMPFRRIAIRARPFGVKPAFSGLGNWLVARRARHGCPARKIYCSQMIVEAYAAAAIYSPTHVLEAAMSPTDLVNGTDFEYVGWLSQAAKPEFNELDIHAPTHTKSVRQWSFSMIRIFLGWIGGHHNLKK